MAVFYLHEDDWGMVNLMPVENIARAKEVAQEAEEFGREHFDGVGWTDMYVIPEEKHPIEERRIRLDELRELVGGHLAEAEKVQSGYSSYVEDLPDTFAFGEGYSGKGAFYGNSKEGLIVRLHLLLCDPEDEDGVQFFARVLGALGERYGLILADWWRDVVIDLGDRERVLAYLKEM